MQGASWRTKGLIDDPPPHHRLPHRLTSIFLEGSLLQRWLSVSFIRITSPRRAQSAGYSSLPPYLLALII
ncbi:hypothetical protein K1719_036087 [Acacia pycnantha]|nr:hypothetical protein K1719_036087 [Acacia pycnantha]